MNPILHHIPEPYMSAAASKGLRKHCLAAHLHLNQLLSFQVMLGPGKEEVAATLGLTSLEMLAVFCLTYVAPHPSAGQDSASRGRSSPRALITPLQSQLWGQNSYTDLSWCPLPWAVTGEKMHPCAPGQEQPTKAIAAVQCWTTIFELSLTYIRLVKKKLKEKPSTEHL